VSNGGPTVVLGFREMWDANRDLFGNPRRDQGAPSPGAHLDTQAFEGGLAFWSRAQLATDRGEQETGYREVMGFAHLSGDQYLWNFAAKRLERQP